MSNPPLLPGCRLLRYLSNSWRAWFQSHSLASVPVFECETLKSQRAVLSRCLRGWWRLLLLLSQADRCVHWYVHQFRWDWPAESLLLRFVYSSAFLVFLLQDYFDSLELFRCQHGLHSFLLPARNPLPCHSPSCPLYHVGVVRQALGCALRSPAYSLLAV